MSSHIAFYGLQSKYVNRDADIPDGARQVIYYSLAIGHHVGVLDCFTCLFRVPVDEFQAWVSQLPPGAGRAKLHGILVFGEIEINHSHLKLLSPLLQTTQSEKPEWLDKFNTCLQNMIQEPAYYLMVRKV